MDLHDNAKKVVVCSALFAGFAYFSLSVLRNVFSSHKETSNSDKDNPKASQSVQTEVTVPIKDKKWFKLPPEMWGPWAKTIQDRIKELNLHAAASGVVLKQGRLPSITANGSSLSSHNTPRHSPRSRSPTRLVNQNNLSQSVENLSKDNHNLHNGSEPDGSTIPTIVPPNQTEMANYKKILDTLYGQKNPNLSQQEASVLGMLLMCDEDELLVKTLSVIADCAVFTPNINIICDSGCLVMLLHLLNTATDASVVAAATQAIGNLATGERAQELMKPFIIPLMEKLRTSSHLQLTWSLLALANLAHRESNHTEFLDHLNELFVLVEKGCSRVRLQALKILVNLSCNPNSTVYLLASKCPSNLHNLLESTTDEEVLIRLCSFICNLVETVFRRNIKYHNLPPINKVASPETLYTGIFGVQSIDILKERLTSLSRFPNDNVTSTVQRIQKKLTMI